jgi:hypothetical protein
VPVTQQDLDWMAARLLPAVYDINRITPEMSVAELKDALRDVPGIETLTISSAPDGNQLLQVGDKTVQVGPMASNDEIKSALLNPFIPTRNTTVSVTGAANAGISLKQKLADRKQKIADAHAKLEANFGKIDQATDAMSTLGDKVGAEADDLMATVGQFMNDLTGEA